jgi:hypothetical protein
MSLMITVLDPLAGRLQLRAQAERVPIDELASRLLETGMQSPLAPAEWTVVNQRRVGLIEKRFAGGLADHEQEELQRLQEFADRQLEESDALMLKDLGRMEHAARKVLEATE